MAFERIKSTFGLGGPDRDFADPEADYRDPAEVADPHTADDETSKTLTDRFFANKWWFLAFGSALFFGLLFFANLLLTYFVALATNPWVHRLLAASGVFVVGRHVGRVGKAEEIEDQEELGLYSPSDGSLTEYNVEWLKGDGERWIARLIKGYQRGDPQYYTLAEVSPTQAAKPGNDPGDPAQVAIHPGFAQVQATDRGRKAVQLSAGLKPYDSSGRANLYATLPEIADEDTFDAMRRELGKANEELADKEQRISTLERQRDHHRERARENFEEVRRHYEDAAEVFEPFATGRRGRSRSDEDRRDEDGATLLNEQIREEME